MQTRSRRRLLALVAALLLAAFSSPWQVFADDDGTPNPKPWTEYNLPDADKFPDASAVRNSGGQNVVGAFIGVSVFAGPEGFAMALVATEMKGLMTALGFFDEPDPLAAAVDQLNNRVSELEKRTASLEASVEWLQNFDFQQANRYNLNLLTQIRNGCSTKLNLLNDKSSPPTAVLKKEWALELGQDADKFIDDPTLWAWSDKAVKDVTWKGVSYHQGDMMRPEFKPVPTIETYAIVLGTWLVAIEAASSGDTEWVKQTYGAKLQKHIAFLSTRPNWNNLTGDMPVSLPENIKSLVRTEYQPNSRYPDAALKCYVNEYIVDDIARERRLALQKKGNQWEPLYLSYSAKSPNEMCSVPPNLVNSKFESAEAEDVARVYGVAVCDMLQAKLTHFKNTGTMRKQYVGTFVPTTVSGDYLYKVKPDGHLYWQGDNEQISAIKPGETGTFEHITHSLTQESQLPYTWNKYQKIIPGGGSTIYTEQDGALHWFSHDGSLTGAPTLRGPESVGSGWGAAAVVDIFSMGNGVLYAILPDGTLRLYKHNNYRTGKGGYSGWSQPIDVGQGWTGNKFVFGGGHGVIYVVTNDGKLNWYRHDYMNPAPLPIPAMWLALPPSAAQAMQNGLRLAWQKSWQGPRLVGTGWNAFTKLFCAGNGHIYGVLPNGELKAYDHVGWQDGQFKWGDSQSLGYGWGANQFVWARMPSDDEDAPVVR